MDRKTAEAVVREKQARLSWIEQVRAIVAIDHELSLHPYDRVRVGLLQQIVAEALRLEPHNPNVQAKVDQALLAIGLTRAKFHGRVHYRGVRKRPE